MESDFFLLLSVIARGSRPIRDPCGGFEMLIQLRCEVLDRGRHEAMLLDFASEFRAEGDDRFDELLSSPDQFFDGVRRFEVALDLPPDRVPMSHFLFFEGSTLVGASRIRWEIVPILLEDGGHIGYEVRRSARARGIAKKILQKSIEMARDGGITAIYLTASVNNRPSLRVIESQGGALRPRDDLAPNGATDAPIRHSSLNTA